MVAVKFEIQFFGPFRVSTGLAGAGSDATVDLADALPASSLKGVMRSAAKQLFGAELAGEVFGTARASSPWSWSGAELGLWTLKRRARVAIDEDTGTAVDEALQFAQELWPNGATFSVDLNAYLDSERRKQHEVVLLVSAHAVHAIGSDRRRGLGWVGIVGVEPPLDELRLEQAVALVVAR